MIKDMNYEADLDMMVDFAGVSQQCYVGFNITERGTIFLSTTVDWMADPDDRPPVKAEYIDDDSMEIQELPEFDIVWLEIPGHDINISGEELRSFLTINTKLKQELVEGIKYYCEQTLSKDALNGQSTFAYYVHVA
jgi:hypothetical protein